MGEKTILERLIILIAKINGGDKWKYNGEVR